MDSSEIVFHDDQVPIPQLYLENISEQEIIRIAEFFSLKIKQFQDGFLLETKNQYSNFKFSYLDLFFTAFFVFLQKNSQASFFLLEQNILREELEQLIIGNVAKETSVESQIKNWKQEGCLFSLSGLAQGALFQAGLLPSVLEQRQDFKLDQLNTILNNYFRFKADKTA